MDAKREQIIERKAREIEEKINSQLLSSTPFDLTNAQVIADEIAGGIFEVRVFEIIGKPRFKAAVMQYLGGR